MSGTLPTSGPISLELIQQVLGGESPILITDYYGIDTLPDSGTISFEDFYGQSLSPVQGPFAQVTPAATRGGQQYWEYAWFYVPGVDYQFVSVNYGISVTSLTVVHPFGVGAYDFLAVYWDSELKFSSTSFQQISNWWSGVFDNTGFSNFPVASTGGWNYFIHFKQDNSHLVARTYDEYGLFDAYGEVDITETNVFYEISRTPINFYPFNYY